MTESQPTSAICLIDGTGRLSSVEAAAPEAGAEVARDPASG